MVVYIQTAHVIIRKIQSGGLIWAVKTTASVNHEILKIYIAEQSSHVKDF